MKKKAPYIIAVLSIISFYALFKISGVLRFYEIPSSSSEPNLKVGSKIVGSSLIKPDRLDFAYFKFSDSLEGWTIVKRLIALPKDTLICKNGKYYVNGINVDEGIDLRFSYKILPKVFEIHLKGKIKETEYFSYYNKDSIIAFLDNSFVEKLPINLDRNYDYNKSRLSKEIFEGNPSWTINDFGPIILPEDKFFFSGDSRDNSIDSRYRGFVHEDNIMGTVFLNF